jgi:hypothetical protein
MARSTMHHLSVSGCFDSRDCSVLGAQQYHPQTRRHNGREYRSYYGPCASVPQVGQGPPELRRGIWHDPSACGGSNRLEFSQARESSRHVLRQAKTERVRSTSGECVCQAFSCSGRPEIFPFAKVHYLRAPAVFVAPQSGARATLFVHCNEHFGSSACIVVERAHGVTRDDAI